MADPRGKKPPSESDVEIITDETRAPKEPPTITVRTGKTGGKMFYVKINQPAGRALLIAVHL